MITRQIPPNSRQTAIAQLGRMIEQFLPGKPLVVTVERLKRQRSDLQLRALWGCAYKALREQTGNDPEDLHAYFAGEYWGWEEFEIMGQIRKRPRRTTTRDENGRRDVISTVVMADFYDFIQRRSAEMGYDVPDPDPRWFERKAA